MSMDKPGAFSLISFLAAFNLSSLIAIAEELPASSTVAIAGQSYTFQIDNCSSINSGENSSFILGGSAQGSDGSMAMLQVSVSKKATKTEHAVSIIKMPIHYVAYAKRIAGEGWKNAQGEPAAPLVTVNGKDVSVSGTFYTANYPPESVGIGTLTAHCGQLSVMNTQ
jgi:hypothetical protein